MSNVSFPTTVRSPIVTLLRFRNGLYPEAGSTTHLQEEANRIVALRGKQWAFASPINSVHAAGGSFLQRWRAFIHTSSHCRYVEIRALAMPSNNTGSPTTTVTFSLAGGMAPVATASFNYGSETSSDTLDAVTVGQARTVSGTALFDLTPDTDYEINIYEAGNARTASVCIWEVAKQRTTENGYVVNGVVGGQDILDVHRGAMTPVLRTAWKRNAAPLITWSTDLDASAYTNASVDDNILDATSTTVTTATPGWTIDTRFRSTTRRSALGVPVIMRAYCKTTGTTGTVKLKDSTGATLATCTTSSATAAWVSSGAFYLPASLAKYDIHGAVTGVGTCTVYAVSLYSIE